jgi:predicted phosphodiesterase
MTGTHFRRQRCGTNNNRWSKARDDNIVEHSSVARQQVPPGLPRLRTFSAAVLMVFFAFTGRTQGATLAAWVQLVGPDDKSIIRVVTNSSDCPVVTADGEELPMDLRAGPARLYDPPQGKEAPVFGVRTCELASPEGKRAVLLDGKPLPLPRRDLKRIVVLGDTGCRIKLKNKPRIQDCVHEWPYRAIAERAAAMKPDLVIHVGDYVYREAACPARDNRCRNSPHGYGWGVWQTDFFDPSKPLLEVAPWITVRGNHETCARGGEGWFRFLHQAELPKRCEEFSKSFVAELGGLGFVVVDSAEAADPKRADKDEEEKLELTFDDVIAAVKSSYTETPATIPDHSWLLTHRPFNAVRKRKGKVDNTVLQHAIGGKLPKSVRMIVSGHIHMFEALSFSDGSPPRVSQLVVGTGGDELGKNKPKKPHAIGDALVTDATIIHKFGFMVWDRDGESWKGTLIDPDGEKLARCKLADRSLTCKKR